MMRGRGRGGFSFLMKQILAATALLALGRLSLDSVVEGKMGDKLNPEIDSIE
jgi:hypothetical protein